MTKKVNIFGRRSLDNARLYVQAHPQKSLVILKNERGRIAVCKPQMAQELKTKGYQPIDIEA
jgi:hypothetical protein